MLYLSSLSEASSRGRGNLAICSYSPTIPLESGREWAARIPLVPEATVGLWPALSALGFTGNDPAPPALSSSSCAHLNLFCRRARFAFVPLRPVVLDLGNDRIRFWPLEYNSQRDGLCVLTTLHLVLFALTASPMNTTW